MRADSNIKMYKYTILKIFAKKVSPNGIFSGYIYGRREISLILSHVVCIAEQRAVFLTDCGGCDH